MDELLRRLHAAIADGDLEVVRQQLAAGADPNGEHEGKTPLDRVPHRADEIRAELIGAGAWQASLVRAMVWAVGTHRVELVQQLIEAQADLNMASPCGTPVGYAARNGDLEIVRCLLEAGADPDVGSSLAVPVNAALDKGHEEVALCLLEGGADPLCDPPAIAKAAATGSVQVVQWLVESGADVDAVAERIVVMPAPSELDRQSPIVIEGSRALHVACRMGHPEIVRLLLKGGADPFAPDGMGRSPREHAEDGRNADVVAALAAYDESAGSRSANQRLLVAAEEGDLDGINAALAEGARTSARDTRADTRTRTPLLLAVMAGQAEAVELLLAAGANPNVSEEPGKPVQYQQVPIGRCPLIEAAHAGNLRMVSALLAAGADPTRVDGTGASALVAACGQGSIDVVEALLKADDSIQPPDRQPKDPLVESIREGRYEVAMRLLDAGLSPKRRDQAGTTPLVEASRRGNPELLRRLIELGANPDDLDENGIPAVSLTMLATDWAMVLPRPIAFAKMLGYDPDVPIRSMEMCPPERAREAMDVLIEAGARLDHGNYEHVPLVVAAREGMLDLTKRLVEAGAPITDDVFYKATAYQNPEIVRFLSRHAKPPHGPDPRYQDIDALEEPAPEPEDPREWKRGPEVVRADLTKAAARPEYGAAVEELGERCGSRPVPLWPQAGHFEIHVRNRLKAGFDIEQVQERWREQGAFVYEAEWRSNKIRVLPTTVLWDVLVVERTNGANYGVGTGRIGRWLEELQREQPFVVTQVQDDTVAGRFLEPVEDPEGLAKSMYELCPDTVDQGFEELEGLVDYLATEGRFHLWWD